MDLIIIKITEDYKEFINHLESAFENNSNCYYNTTGKNKAAYDKIYDKIGHRQDPIDTIFVIHKDNIPKQVYVCKSQKIETNSNIMCHNIYKSSKSSFVEDFLYHIGLDLEKNFDKNVYICHKPVVDNKFKIFIKDISEPYKIKLNDCEKQIKEINELLSNEISLDSDNVKLHPLAQRDVFCLRPICSQEKNKDRNEFQRDRERIVHTKAYRRLVDKAQIFTSNKGDHYRTRLTHTLEVSQIARGIAQRLGLNTDLTEAIALGHDIGHTPFGHQGERTIDNILSGKIDIIPSYQDEILIKGIYKDDENTIFYNNRNVNASFNGKTIKTIEPDNSNYMGGFKHNYQSLRVLTYLEEKYIEHEGLDLSYQTLEGILKHTKCKNKKFDIKDFLINGDEKYLNLNINFPTTLEGQVVKIADEIAQRGHDLDDAFASGLLTLSTFKNFCDPDFMEPIKNIVIEIEKTIEEYKGERRQIIDEVDLMRARLVSKILNLLMNDVIKNSLKNMESFHKRKYNEFINSMRIDEELIIFEGQGKSRIEYIEEIISKNVINSFEVSRFDSKAEYIIKSLFEAYFKNPKLLPDSVILRLKRDGNKNNVEFIHLRTSKPGLVNEELKEITEITNKQLENPDVAEEYKKKRKILARCIADHISGMTDNYALNEYSKLFESFSGHM